MAPLSDHPRLRREVILRKMEGREEPYAVAREPDEQKYFKFEAWEHDLLTLLDGTRDLDAVARDFGAGHPGMDLDRASIAEWVEGVRRLGLLERTEQERHVAMIDRLRSSRKRRLWDAERSTLSQILIPLWDPDRQMDFVMRWIRWWWSPWFVTAWVVVFAGVLGYLVRHWDLYWAGFFSLLDVTNKTAGDWIVLLALVFAISIWHELGHGLTCKRFGGEVHSIGVMVFYLSPAFYCGIDDSYLFPRRSHRMYVAFGGSYFELMLCSLAMPVWLLTPAEWPIHGLAMTAIFFSGLSLIAFNLNPLIKLDGYYVLMDWLDVPNLREESFAYIGNLLKRHVLHLAVPLEPVSRRRRRIYLVYGALSLAYTALVFGIIYVLVRDFVLDWFGPAGYLLLAAGAALAFRKRLREIALFVRHLWLDKREWILSPSGGATAALAAIVLVLLLTVPRSATRIESPFVVEPGARAVVRAPAEGVVVAVRATEGATVTAGETLARIDNPELLAERALAASDLELRRREAVRAREIGDAALAREHEARAAEAGARLGLLSRRIAALALPAPIDGIVSTPYLEDRLGAHLDEGEEFCAVDRLDTVRLAVSASERDLEEIGEESPVRIRLTSRPWSTLASRVLSLSPEATPPPGPDNAAVDLVRRAHRVRVLVEIDNRDGALRPGMTGTLQFLAAPRSAAGKAWWRFHRWAASVLW